MEKPFHAITGCDNEPEVLKNITHSSININLSTLPPQNRSISAQNIPIHVSSQWINFFSLTLPYEIFITI